MLVSFEGIIFHTEDLVIAEVIPADEVDMDELGISHLDDDTTHVLVIDCEDTVDMIRVISYKSEASANAAHARLAAQVGAKVI